MLKRIPYRQVTVAVLVAFAAVSGAAAGTSANADTPPSVADGPTAPTALTATPENVSVTFPEEPLVLRSAENQTIRFATNAEPGTELHVDLESDASFRTGIAEVGEDGTASATFDLSEVEDGTELEVDAFSVDASARARVVNESATVHREGALTLSDPVGEYPIRGRTDLAPGTELDVRLSGRESSFSASRSVVVDENGRYTATFDVSSLPEGAELRVDVGGLPRSVSVLATTDDRVGATVYVRPDVPAAATVRYPGDELLVRAAPNQTIRGTTNVQPGTELVVHVENAEMNVPSRVDRSVAVTVRPNGTFAATFDFGGVAPETALAIEINRVDGVPLAYVEAVVVNESVDIPTTTPAPTTFGEETEAPFRTTATRTPDTPDGGIPGFGVPAAVSALLAALALAKRA